MNKLRLLFADLRSSFWFLPLLMVTSSIAFAVVLIEADSAGLNLWLNQWPRLFGAGAQGARLMLSTLAGSMMTIMGITFSMTLLALVLASGQYTSRILRNFMRSRVTQSTLGVFASVFAYCLIVLRTIRGNGGTDEFVPSLAVFFAFMLSLGGVGVLIYFIHHIALSIQASSIIASVAEETNAAIDRLLPDKDVLKPDEKKQQEYLAPRDERTWYPVPASSSGYVQSVNQNTLLQLAESNRTIVRMEHGIGAFVVKDTALVSLALTYPAEQKLIGLLNSAYSIGPHRTVDQDPAFGVRQIVDIALKALSPGVNDTSTAIVCVDYLSSIMARLTGRQFPASLYYEHESLRVVGIVQTFEQLLAEAFDQIRSNAEVNVAILLRILGAIDTIAGLTIRSGYLDALDEQLQRIAELVNRCIKSNHDRAQLTKRITKVRKTLKKQCTLKSQRT